MPKIVDHEAYRRDIIDKAVNVFRAKGYAGIGMREMAKELGMSKSALYHYFPSKDALFIACSKRVEEFTPNPNLPAQEALVNLAQEWEEVFPGEVRIILDYIGERKKGDLQSDEAIGIAIQGFEQSLASIVPKDRIDQVLAVMFGFLLLRYFNGQATPWVELERLIGRVLAEEG